MFDMEAFRHGTSFPMMLHWDLFLPNEGLWPKTEIIKDTFARIGVFFFFLLFSSKIQHPCYHMRTNYHTKCASSVKKDNLMALRPPSFRNSDTLKSVSAFPFFFCLEFMAALSLLAHSEGSTEPGRHPIPQWQQQGVIITIQVKVLPIFHARGHTARKGGRRGFKKQTHLYDENVSIWKAAFKDIPTFHTVRGGYKTHGFSKVNSHHWLRMKVKQRSAILEPFGNMGKQAGKFKCFCTFFQNQSGNSLFFL